MKLEQLIKLSIFFFLLISYAGSVSAFAANGLQITGSNFTALTKTDIKTGKNVLHLIRNRDWQIVKRHIIKIGNPLLRKALLWQYYTSRNSGARFSEINKFIRENPEWPSQTLLRKRAEESMRPGMDPEKVTAWFKNNSPMTPDGGIRPGVALLQQKNKSDAIKVFQNTWVKGNFGARQERLFYKKYRHYLTRDNHLQRLERLLWKGRYYPVRRMLHKVNKDYRALAFARITLRRFRGGVDRTIAKVPHKLLNEPGLIFERLRWRRRKGRDQDAIKLFANLPSNLEHAERWWKEKAILVRRILQSGHISQAYDLARNHGLTEGKYFVEAEWLAGWIALRFLKESALALQHFDAVFKKSRYPISRARGAYWAARTAEALNNQRQAQVWYRKAASFDLTFYGQQAALKLNSKQPENIVPDSTIKGNFDSDFKNNKLVSVIKVLTKAEMSDLLKPFLYTLNEKKSSAIWYENVARLARESGRSDLAIYISKKAYRSGFTLIKEGFPTLTIKNKIKIDLAFLYALIRQESAFNVEAISHAGARGLMQIMPATAKRLAKKYKIPYQQSKLTSDVNYNLKIGQVYLQELLKQFDGSLVLTLAAYNAGPARAKIWIKRNGDPRNIDIDKIDWIEMISFGETRNYIQRVIENYRTYRTYLNKSGKVIIPKAKY